MSKLKPLFGKHVAEPMTERESRLVDLLGDALEGLRCDCDPFDEEEPCDGCKLKTSIVKVLGFEP